MRSRGREKHYFGLMRSMVEVFFFQIINKINIRWLIIMFVVLIWQYDLIMIMKYWYKS